MTNSLKITLAQINPIVGDLDYNAALISAAIKRAPDHTDLIVFPEMAICGYPPEDLVLKPSFLDQVKKTIEQICNDHHDDMPWLILPAPWHDIDDIKNAALIIGDGKIQQIIFKYHLPNYGVFDEARIFKNSGFADPINYKGHKIGLMICEDMWFSDVSAHLKEKGATLLISVNASPYEIDKRNQREEHAKARVKECGLPLLCVNQCGGQDELVFDGGSFIMDDQGQIIASAKEFIEDSIDSLWTLNEDSCWQCKAGEIAPRYDETSAIYQALMTGLRDYVLKNNFPGVIIGLSGGIDSALAAAIAADALGANKVHCVMMPSKYTSEHSLNDARDCAEVDVKLYKNPKKQMSCRMAK